MATDAIRRRRTKAEAAARVARVRREKVLLVLGVVVLAGLLAFEGPKTLRRFQSTSPAPVPAPATTTKASGTVAAKTAPLSAALKAVSRYRTKDPFVPQVAASTAGSNVSDAVSPAKPPKVRTAHFVQKDPFVQQLGGVTGTSAPLLTATPPVVTGPAPLKHKSKKAGSKQTVQANAAAKPQSPSGSAPHVTAFVSGIVVIVESVPVTRGIVAAKRVAVAARTRGVPKANLLFSSRYPALRSGFYAVYSGPYSTSARALQALKVARESGYAGAYVRHLGR